MKSREKQSADHVFNLTGNVFIKSYLQLSTFSQLSTLFITGQKENTNGRFPQIALASRGGKRQESQVSEK